MPSSAIITDHPTAPDRADYEAARARLALLDVPDSPPQTCVDTPADSPGAVAREVSNPAYGAWDQARHSAGNDRAIVAAYESWADEHAQLYSDVRRRNDLGIVERLDESFADAYERHVDDRVAAGELAPSPRPRHTPAEQ